MYTYDTPRYRLLVTEREREQFVYVSLLNVCTHMTRLDIGFLWQRERERTGYVCLISRTLLSLSLSHTQAHSRPRFLMICRCPQILLATLVPPPPSSSLSLSLPLSLSFSFSFPFSLSLIPPSLSLSLCRTYWEYPQIRIDILNCRGHDNRLVSFSKRDQWPTFSKRDLAIEERVAACCSVLQGVATCCRVSQCVTVCRSVLLKRPSY